MSDLLSNPVVGRPEHLDQAKVERYTTELDRLPAVVVFRTPDGLLLADGYHRATAAARLGRSTVVADVREGTRRDALMHAVEVGARETGLSREQVLHRILGRPADPWGVAALDVGAYLARVGQPDGPPTAETLRRLHAAHVDTLPFENVDVVLGTHRGLALDVVVDKLVDRRRGGYCFEHAVLMAAVLERLGFEVTRLGARNPPGTGIRGHMMLLARPTAGDDRATALVDVGFGSGPRHPMPLRDGVVVDQAGWPHRLDADGEGWTLSKRTAEGWTVLHGFDLLPQQRADYEVVHHYTSTHPHSPYTGKLVAMRLAPGVVRKLVGGELSTEHPDGTRTVRHVTPDEAPDVLGELGVVLDDAERAVLVPRLRDLTARNPGSGRRTSVRGCAGTDA